jgi:uncharacterized membrane protein YccC
VKLAALRWGDGLRLALAGTAAFALARALHLPEGTWAVLSALIVTRANRGATLRASAARLIGTLCGAGLGVLAAAGRLWQVPELALLAAALLPLGLLVAWRPDYRTAPIAAVIVFSAGLGGGSPLAAAGLRVAEIALGALTALAVSWALLPGKSLEQTERAAARLLAHLHALALLAGAATEAARRDELLELCRGELRNLTILSQSAGWEPRAHERAQRLAKLMGRVYADVALVVRAAADRRAAAAVPPVLAMLRRDLQALAALE